MSTDSVRKLFPQLLANGYVPLPNRDKICMLPKWSTIEVDERQCALWTRQTRWPAIGLRVEPPLLVLDFDIPQPDILKAIEDITPSVVFDGLERHGNAPKTAFFLRLSEEDEPFRKFDTHRYIRDGKTFALETFGGGGGGAQVGSFGPHSHDDAGVVLKTYSWVGGRSPATVPIWDLPVMRRSEVADLVDAVDALLAGWPGLVRDEKSSKGEAYHAENFLTDDMTFIDAEESEYTLDELIAEAKARKELGQPELRITGSFTDDPTSSGSPRCRVFYSKQHGVTVVDYKYCVTYRPSRGDADPELQNLLSKIFNTNKKA